jgi:hypothetical protein
MEGGNENGPDRSPAIRQTYKSEPVEQDGVCGAPLVSIELRRMGRVTKQNRLRIVQPQNDQALAARICATRS